MICPGYLVCLENPRLGWHDGVWPELLASFLFSPNSWNTSDLNWQRALRWESLQPSGALSESINLWLDFSEAHWDCSCKRPDSRRAFELTALFRGDGQHRPWISSGCLSSPPSSSSVVAGYMWKRRDSVFDAFLILPSNMSQAHLLRVKGQGYWTSCWSLVIE